jgi:hypothetical protein
VIYDDFLEYVEGAVELAMKELSSDRSNDRHSTPTSPSAPRRTLKNFSSSVNERLNSLTLVLSKTIKGWRHKKDDEEDSSQEMTDLHGDNTYPHKFLFLCISQWRRYYMTKMISVNVNINSDDVLFRLLRSNYALMIGPWRRILSLRYVSDIRFVQVKTPLQLSPITIKLNSSPSFTPL